MYKIYQAETVDAAIKKGLEELKVSESDIRIDVEEQGSKGFLGFGKKASAVKLSIISPELKAYGSIDELIAREISKENNDEESTEDTLAEEGTNDGNDIEEIEHVNDVETTTGVETSKDGEIFETENAVSESQSISIEEAAGLTVNYIHQVVNDMKIDNKASYNITDNQIWIELESEIAAKLIGKRGQTLNALQEIAQNYFNGLFKSYGSIILDAENYRMKRRETLENLAVNMSKKALRTNEPVKMEPMPSFERKIMHHVLSNLENVRTYSEGKDPNRYIVIEKR